MSENYMYVYIMIGQPMTINNDLLRQFCFEG